METTNPKYVLVVMGRIVAQGDDPEELFANGNPDSLNSKVKSFRQHKWIDGIRDSIFHHRHCEYCKTTRQADGSLDSRPCKYPERSDDETVEVFEYHPPHTSTRCCPQHNHHAEGIHVNCVFR